MLLKIEPVLLSNFQQCWSSFPVFFCGAQGGRAFCIFPLSSSPWSLSIVYLDFLFCAVSPISASHHCPENRDLWFCSLMFSRCPELYHGRTWRKTQICQVVAVLCPFKMHFTLKTPSWQFSTLYCIHEKPSHYLILCVMGRKIGPEFESRP